MSAARSRPNTASQASRCPHHFGRLDWSGARASSSMAMVVEFGAGCIKQQQYQHRKNKRQNAVCRPGATCARQLLTARRTEKAPKTEGEEDLSAAVRRALAYLTPAINSDPQRADWCTAQFKMPGVLAVIQAARRSRPFPENFGRLFRIAVFLYDDTGKAGHGSVMASFRSRCLSRGCRAGLHRTHRHSKIP